MYSPLRKGIQYTRIMGDKFTPFRKKKQGKGKKSQRTAYTGGTKQLKPGAGVVIRHSEQIASLTATNTGFAVLGTYDLMPTDATTFPWLSSIARNYEKYKFNSVTFRLTTASPMTAGGMVTVCFDYDYADPVPVTEQAMTMNESWKQTPIRESLSLILRGDRLGPQRYCDYRSGDLRLVYAGFLTVATAGISVGYSASLWVDYDVTLSSPTVPTETLVVLPPASGAYYANGIETPFERLFRYALEEAPSYAKFLKMGLDGQYRFIVPPKTRMEVDTCVPYGVSDSYLPTPTPPYQGCETIPTLEETADVTLVEFPCPCASFGLYTDPNLHKWGVFKALSNSAGTWHEQSLSDLWTAVLENFSDEVREVVVNFPYRAALLESTDFFLSLASAVFSIALTDITTKSSASQLSRRTVIGPQDLGNTAPKTKGPTRPQHGCVH